MNENNFILAFDPGRDKTGFALVNFQGGLIFSGIFPTAERENFFDMLLKNSCGIENFLSKIKFIAVGNGTHSKNFIEYVKNKTTLEIKITDEKNTTLEARKLYWKIHAPGFFERLLPEGLRVPPRILDDLAAWAIALNAVKG